LSKSIQAQIFLMQTYRLVLPTQAVYYAGGMTFLPIIDRELRVRARQAGTYNGRWVAVLLACLVSLPFLLNDNPRGGGPDGKTYFTILSALAFAYCLFGGARVTSDCLSSEKREGTLGLLFLTHLKGYDVVLGKLVSNSLSSFYGLLAVMPVFGLALLMGGVTGGEFWRVTLVLINTLFFSLAVGLWISARSKDEHRILVATNLLLAGLAGGFVLIDFVLFQNSESEPGLWSLLSPGFGCYLAFDLPYKSLAGKFWESLGLVHIAAWFFLGLAARAVLHYRQDELNTESTMRSVAPQASALASTARHKARQQDMSINPVLWLAQHQSGKKTLIWSLFGLCIGLSLFNVYLSLYMGGVSSRSGLFYVLALLSPIASFILWYAVAAAVCRFFVQARRNGTMELLLSTPVSDRTLFQGLRLHLKKLLAGPVLCLVLVQLASRFVALMANANMSQPVSTGLLVQVLLAAVSVIVHTIALCYVGLWLSLSLKKPGQATIRTWMYVMLLPYLFCSFPISAFMPIGIRGGSLLIPMLLGSNPLFFILVNVWLIRWARRHLDKGIRSTAMRHLTGEPPPPPHWRDPKNDLSENFSLLEPLDPSAEKD
jgi:hypothetical protein